MHTLLFMQYNYHIQFISIYRFKYHLPYHRTKYMPDKFYKIRHILPYVFFLCTMLLDTMSSLRIHCIGYTIYIEQF